MRPLYLIIFLLFWGSCSETKVEQDQPETSPTTENLTTSASAKETQNQAFQKIIDDAKLNGVILIFDPQKNEFISNDFERSDRGYLPASTFKIPNSLILMETGVVDENTVFKWDGEERYLKVWERDFVFKDAFKYSCLPCYQEATPNVGVNRMKDFLKKFEYGKMKIDSASMNSFWISGDSEVTARQQIEFLLKFYNSKLPISKKTENFVKDIMVIDEKDTYKLSGKTGWLIDDDFNLGWFVGFVEKGENIYFVATNVDPKNDFDMDNFLKIRLKVSLDAMKELKII